jgi:hypothetical protein
MPPIEVHPYCEMDGESPVYVAIGQPVTLRWTWTALQSNQVQDHIDAATYTITLDGVEVEAQRRTEIEYDSVRGHYRVSWSADVGVLSAGEHLASRALAWSRMIFDGWDTFGPGSEIETEYHTCTIIVQ